MSSYDAQLKTVRLLVLDVDGVLTNGQIVYDALGNELKAFDVQDGLGLVLLKQMGIPVVWISGRKHPGTERRGRELGIDRIYQGVRDKRTLIQRIASELKVDLQDVAYVGDDWNDLPAFEIVGLRCAVANAVKEVKEAAHFVTKCRGGQGAVREICMMILEAQGRLDSIVSDYLHSLSLSPNADESDTSESVN